MNLVMDWVAMVTEAGFWWLLIWSWQGAIVIVGVWLGIKLFRVQSPALRHQIWLLSLIAVAVLPVLNLMVQVLPAPRPSGEPLINVAALSSTITRADSQPSAQAALTSLDPSTAETGASPLIIWSLLFIAWIAGVAVAIFRMTRDSRRLSRLRREAQPTTLEELDCGDWKSLLDGVGQVRIAFHDLIGSPVLAGIWRPSILLPADLNRWTTAAERRAIIEHEIAHLARLDNYANLFLKVLNAFFYFHPLVILARKQLEIEREAACDDRVISRGTEAEVYAEGILKVAGRGVMFRERHQLGMASPKQILERRIGMILNKDRLRHVSNYRRKLILSVALISLWIWMMTPVYSGHSTFGDGGRSARRNSDLHYVTAYVTLTAEQKEQLKQASKSLSEGLPRLVSISSEEFAKWLWDSQPGKAFYKTSDGKYAGWARNSTLNGFIKNASPLSPQLTFKTYGFDRSVTIDLTEEQRRQFNRIFHRSITALSFEPTQEGMISIWQTERGYRGAIVKLKNTIAPDAYSVTFYSPPEEELKMEVQAVYREHRLLGRDWYVHNLWSLFYPDLYPSRRQLSDEESGEARQNLPPPPGMKSKG